MAQPVIKMLWAAPTIDFTGKPIVTVSIYFLVNLDTLGSDITL
jgi:hypothetical protein